MQVFEGLAVDRIAHVHTVSAPLLKEVLEMGPVARVVSADVVDLLKMSFVDLPGKKYEYRNKDHPL